MFSISVRIRKILRKKQKKRVYILNYSSLNVLYPFIKYILPVACLRIINCICRLVSSSRQSDFITFSVRCGTSEGVITHHLKAETHRDLANWARTIVQGCHTSVMLQKELSLSEYTPLL